jgi:hypothetical protein
MIALHDPRAVLADHDPVTAPEPTEASTGDGGLANAGTSALLGRWYVGERCRAGCRVTVIDGVESHPLRPRTHDPLWSFSWGRAGASARELAWSMLYDSGHDSRLADDWCSAFTAEVIARLPHDAFCVASRDVMAWLHEERSG